MTTVLQTSKLLAQFYPIDSKSLFAPILINSTTRIMELVTPYKKRSLTNRNKYIKTRIYRPKAGKYTRSEERFCPVVYTKVLCHACYKEIALHDLYLSKNGEKGRTKFYHVYCAELKNVL